MEATSAQVMSSRLWRFELQVVGIRSWEARGYSDRGELARPFNPYGATASRGVRMILGAVGGVGARYAMVAYDELRTVS